MITYRDPPPPPAPEEPIPDFRAPTGGWMAWLALRVLGFAYVFLCFVFDCPHGQLVDWNTTARLAVVLLVLLVAGAATRRA